MKESKAKMKFCPFVRESAHAEYRCAGSQCMMWENWEYEYRNIITEETEIKNKGEGDCGLKSKDLDCRM